MRGRGFRILGHPVHPVLTAFPIGLWGASLIWDLVGLLRPEALWGQLAFWSLALGLVAFVPTALTGFIDVLNLPSGARVEELSTRHMMTAFGAATFFSVSLVLRHFQDNRAEPGLDLAFSVSGLICVLVAGWHGAELVFSHGVGVAAPSSPENGDST